MPHLMLSFEATREMTQEEVGFGQIRHKPTGRESISFVMIDTDTNKVIELTAEASNVHQVEREPRWSEQHTAEQVLVGKKPELTQAEYEKMKAERDSYRQKHTSSQVEISRQKDQISDLMEKIKSLQARDFNNESMELLSAALDSYIIELAANQNFSSYELAKQIYHHLTGQAWADEFGEEGDDDEEGDLSPPSRTTD
jgi:hypothetical protein